MAKCKWDKDMMLSHCNLKQCEHRLHPDKVDKNCNIVPAKPRKAKPRREKDVVIKAWAEGINGDIFCDTCWSKGNYRVEIHIKAEDYKKLKGNT